MDVDTPTGSLDFGFASVPHASAGSAVSGRISPPSDRKQRFSRSFGDLVRTRIGRRGWEGRAAALHGWRPPLDALGDAKTNGGLCGGGRCIAAQCLGRGVPGYMLPPVAGFAKQLAGRANDGIRTSDGPPLPEGQRLPGETRRTDACGLRLERERGLNPDFVVFSGDLVNNPDEPDIYAYLERQVFAAGDGGRWTSRDAGW